MNRTVIFEHIPKTAGSTLNNILHKQYKEIHAIDSLRTLDSIQDFNTLPPKKQQQIQLVRGHGASLTQPSVHDAFIFTMLRDPIKRMLSQYHYLRTRYDHPSADATRSLSFSDYLDYALEHGEDNLQTRFLSSLLTDSLSFQTPSVNDQHLQEAKQTLESFDLVLFTEHFDASLLQLKTELEWNSWPFYTKQNESRKTPVELDDQTLKKIKDYESFDIQLYNWAQSTFEHLAKENELQKFKRLNALYSKLRAPYDFLKSLYKGKS